MSLKRYFSALASLGLLMGVSALIASCTNTSAGFLTVFKNGSTTAEAFAIRSAESVSVRDLDGDGDDDYLVPRGDAIAIYIRRNGVGNSTVFDRFDIPTAQIGSLQVGKLGQNAAPDVIMRTPTGMQVINDIATPTPGTPQPIATGEIATQPTAFVLRDFDNDGDDDLAVNLAPEEDERARCRIYRNDTPPGEPCESGDLVLVDTLVLDSGPEQWEFTCVESGNLNADAHPDLVLCDAFDAFVVAGAGDCTFDPLDIASGAVSLGSPLSAGTIPGSENTTNMAISDWDNDGNDDILSVKNLPPHNVRFGNGNGIFDPPTPFMAGIFGQVRPLAADINGNGTRDIITFIPTSDTVQNSSRIAVTLVNPDQTLAPTITMPTVDRPSAMTVLNLPESGPHMLVLSQLDERGVLHRNIGGALTSFQRYESLSAVNGAIDVAVGDLTGDGYADAYYTTTQSFSSSVLVNRADGSGLLDAPRIPGPNTANVQPLVFVPRPDLDRGVVAAAFAPSNRLIFGVVEDISGDIRLRYTTVIVLTATPRDIAQGDFNNDGLPDVALLMTTPTPGLAISFQQSGGTFTNPPTYYDLSSANPPQGWWTRIATVIIDGGADDLAVSGPGGAGILRNNGAGFDFFSAFEASFAGGVNVAAGDVNADGRADLCTGRDLGGNTGSVIVSLQTTSGPGPITFDAPVSYPLTGTPRGLALADLDNDGDLDLAAAISEASASAMHSVTVLNNNGAGVFDTTSAVNHLCGRGQNRIVIADLHRNTNERGTHPNAGPEITIAATGISNTPYEGVQVLMNIADFAAVPPPCPGDADASGAVNFADITSVLTFFGADYSPGTGEGDADHNGPVNFADITAVLTNFGLPCPG